MLFLYELKGRIPMLYLVTKLLTENDASSFSVVGTAEDIKSAAALAADAYKDYNKAASFQNLEMIAEWLRTRCSYSFRKDKSHRLQLAITELSRGAQPKEKQLIFSAAAEEEELMRKVSEALFEGKHHAERGSSPVSCPLE